MNKTWCKIKEIILQLKGLTAIGIVDILGNTISAILWFFMAITLGAEQYGKIAYFLAIAGIASAISLVGSENTLMIYTAKNVKIQSSIYFISLIASAVSFVVIFLIFNNLGISMLVLGYVIFGLAVSEILGRKLYITYSKYVITQKILMVILVIGLYYLIGSDGVILGLALAFFPYVIRIYNEFKDSKIDLSLLKSRFGFIMNSYILSLSGIAIRSTDKLIIAPMFGFALLGNYQLGIQFLDILQVFPAIIYKYILPYDAIGNSNKKLKRAIVYVSIALTILMFLLSPVIVPVIFPKFSEAVEIIQITSFAIIPSSISITYISKFLGEERSRTVLASSGLYFIVQILAIAFLGGIFGINGIAASLVLAGTAQTVFLVIANHLIKKK